MRMFERLKSWFGQLPTVWGRGELGGFYPLADVSGAFQRNLTRDHGHSIAALQNAINAHVSAFALMPVEHKKRMKGGGFETIDSGYLVRFLARPNGFQTPSEFFSVGVRQLLETGDAVAVCGRDGRFGITAAVWARSHSVRVHHETGEVYYFVTLGDGRASSSFIAPARDVLHLRINASVSDPFRGRSPVQFCASSLAVNAQLSAFLNSYLANRASPSYVLSTDAVLTEAQNKMLRAAWNEQSKNLASGGTPILSNGLKPMMLGAAPGDELLVSTFNMSVEDIARAFNMPRALLGINETAANAEQLMRSWVSLGLGSLVELVEQGIERWFDLPPDEHVEFDHNALTRLDSEAQMRVISEGVTKGILSADEGRARLGLPPIPGGFGRIPAAQQQQVPLDLLHQLHEAEIGSRLAPEPEPAPANDASAEGKDFLPKSMDVDLAKGLIDGIIAKARTHA